MASPQFQPVSNLYETDFYDWTRAMATALRQGRWQDLDIDNLAEEIESLGRSDKRALKSRLEVLLMHLLKWKYQPEHRSNSWRSTIIEQRLRIQDLLEDSPSLQPYLEAERERCYANACKLAAAETGLDLRTFPSTCPFTLKVILSEMLLPETETQGH
ncbi:MAG: DUF29 domain-containing protein [Leptolyngbya sp. SIO1E4]|nr:DUF29 domain-containing protein [Leptolyngbya sp. SIO1E4]